MDTQKQAIKTLISIKSINLIKIELPNTLEKSGPIKRKNS